LISQCDFGGHQHQQGAHIQAVSEQEIEEYGPYGEEQSVDDSSDEQ